MAGLTANSTFKVGWQATRQTTSSATVGTTLSGNNNGLRNVAYPLTTELREIEGYYAGTRNSVTTNRSRGTFSFTVDLNRTTKALFGSRGQYMVFEEVIKEGSTTITTIRGQALISNADRIDNGDGTFGIQVEGVLVDGISST